MKVTLSMLVVLTALETFAADRDLVAGREYFANGEYRKAAAYFEAACKTEDAEACYWAGRSYETLADVATPLGCGLDGKAHRFFIEATKLAPDRLAYRDALFDFLLNTADCSRTALREAAAMLSATPEGDPNYADMRFRLKYAKRMNGSVNACLGRIFLIIPRATFRMSAIGGE